MSIFTVFLKNKNFISKIRSKVTDYAALTGAVLSVTDESIYCKCSKILNAFLALFSDKVFVFRAGIHKMIIRIANREDPDQTASSEAV